MTAAAVKTLTETNRVNLGGRVELVTGTVTIATTLDWVDLTTLNPALTGAISAHAFTVADGVDGEAYFNASGTPTQVFFTQTGAMNVAIVAVSDESTGGD